MIGGIFIPNFDKLHWYKEVTVLQDTTVSIMGTCYDIHFVDEYPERLKDAGEYADGLFNRCNREIYILKSKEKDFTDEGRERHMNRVLRHEIMHAYLEESGLAASSNMTPAWAQNEEMVDWLAIQSPKIFATFQEVGCLD